MKTTDIFQALGSLLLAAFGAIVFSVIVFAGLGFAVSRILKADPGYAELSEAGEWAELQGIELTHRHDSQTSTPKLLRKADGAANYDVIGLSTSDLASPIVWILLSEHRANGSVFSMPQVNSYALACHYIDELKGVVDLDAVVERNLRSHCN
jgi:hypothetical protein